MYALRRIPAVLGTAIVLAVLFGLLGLAMTPGWSVRPNTSHVTVASPDTAISARGVDTDHEGRYAVKTSTLRVRLTDAVTVSALLREPIGAQGTRPACLFIEGAGTGSSTEVFGDIAQAMASAGIVTLVPDKRLDNYTPLHRDYHAMARDYMTSLNLLRGLPGVDPVHAGIYAESEGTWIASVMAHDHPDIGFMILTSPPVVPGRHLMAMAATTYLEHVGAVPEMSRDISKIISMDFSSIGLEYADFPSERYLPSLTMPMLVNFGTRDLSMPIEQGANMLLKATSRTGNRNVTLRYYAANHQIRTGASTALPGLPLAQGYTRNLEDWLNAVAAGTTADGWNTPMIAGAQPDQRLATPQGMRPGLIRSPTMLLAIVVLMAVLLALAALGAIVLGVTGLAAGLRGRRQASQSPAHRNPDTASDHVDPHFRRELIAPMLLNAVCAIASMGVLGRYLVLTAQAALTLDAQETAFEHWWRILQFLTAAGVLMLAWLAVALIGRTVVVDGTRRRIRAVRGFGHWFVACCITATTVLSLAMLAFWGLFSL
ncbi:alpha/beta hydrolase [Bifidobacterium mongoliense]|uniref:alpha/beta hydrolase family protein n=1 Tax=Bifidobacterium mongoliense TaxID=518643 RepID=UPI0030ED9FCA